MSYRTTKNKAISVNGLKIAYREMSQGQSALPLVMLVHLAANLDNWDPQLIDLLSAHQHVILLDLPGVGASEGTIEPTLEETAHFVIAIVHALGYEKINLLGLSMGGNDRPGGCPCCPVTCFKADFSGHGTTRWQGRRQSYTGDICPYVPFFA